MKPQEQVALAATIAPLGEPAAACAWLAEVGLRGVQLSATHPTTRPRDLGTSARRDLRAMIARHGMVVAGIDAWIPSEHFVDPATAERAIDAVRSACELAGALGRVPVCIQLPPPTEETDRAARRNEAALAMTEAAERHGVRLADASEAAPALRTPPGGVLVDPAAVLARGGNPARAVAQAGNALVAARLVDLLRSGQRGPVGMRGEAQLDLLAYRIALELSGLHGLPVIDARQWADPRAGVQQSVAAWLAAAHGVEPR